MSYCKLLVQQANRIIKEGEVSIDGRDTPIELFLGGDYKVHINRSKLKEITSTSHKITLLDILYSFIPKIEMCMENKHMVIIFSVSTSNAWYEGSHVRLCLYMV